MCIRHERPLKPWYKFSPKLWQLFMRILCYFTPDTTVTFRYIHHKRGM